MVTQNAGYYVVGLTELRAAMKTAGVDTADLKTANQRVSTFVADVARPMVPVGDTGNLQGTVRGSRQVGRAVVRAGSAAVPYAGNNHYGWPGRPNMRRGWRGGSFKGSFFIIDAAQRSERVWLDFYLDDLQRIIDRIGEATPATK
jgi:hypothetical protein